MLLLLLFYYIYKSRNACSKKRLPAICKMGIFLRMKKTLCGISKGCFEERIKIKYIYIFFFKKRCLTKRGKGIDSLEEENRSLHENKICEHMQRELSGSSEFHCPPEEMFSASSRINSKSPTGSKMPTPSSSYLTKAQ